MKLYVVVRDDLPVGLQAAQAAHALREFQEHHPEIERAWYANSKTLVLLKSTDIWSLAREANLAKVPIALNFEPDLQGALTAVALGTQAKKLVRALPLLG
jgi:peptidyl-tRNA hydrolase